MRIEEKLSSQSSASKETKGLMLSSRQLCVNSLLPQIRTHKLTQQHGSRSSWSLSQSGFRGSQSCIRVDQTLLCWGLDSDPCESKHLHETWWSWLNPFWTRTWSAYLPPFGWLLSGSMYPSSWSRNPSCDQYEKSKLNLRGSSLKFSGSWKAK